MFFALFLYNESVISSLTYNVFNIHIKYKVSRIKIGICYGMTPISVTDMGVMPFNDLDNRDFHDIGNVWITTPRNVYIYIISYSKSISHKECHFFPPKISMITYRFFYNKKLIKRLGFRHHIPCFCSISTEIIPNTAHHSTVLHLWAMMVFCSWMNQPFKWFGSIAMTHLLTVTCWHLLAVLISHLSIFYFIILFYLLFLYL